MCEGMNAMRNWDAEHGAMEHRVKCGQNVAQLINYVMSVTLLPFRTLTYRLGLTEYGQFPAAMQPWLTGRWEIMLY